MIEKLSNLLYKNFVINKRYNALQSSGVYYAKKQPINKNTIINILKNKESFLCYQEDFNKIKWICFDFDINKQLIESGEFEKQKQILYKELFNEIEILVEFLVKNNIDYLLEFSGNRGIHLWILFEKTLSRQEGYIILDQIIKQSNLKLDETKFSLDKFPKSFKSKNNTDKGLGVKLPLSYHQKSKKYSYLFKNFDEINVDNLYIEELNEDFILKQIELLENYKKINKEEIFKKLNINSSIFIEYDKREKNSYLKVKSISFNNIDLNDIKLSLSKCKHLEKIFNKNYPNEKERRIIVGLFSRLKIENQYIGKELLYKYFMNLHNPIESIIRQRLKHCEYFEPPTCDFFRNTYNEDCLCENIKQTPLEYLEGFSYEDSNIFDLNDELFVNIKNSQIKYTKKNDEIPFIHTIDILKKIDLLDIKEQIGKILDNDEYLIEDYYKFEREELNKTRKLFALKANDKIITTYFIKILDSVLYSFFSSRSYGYRFNPSFRHNNIFEEWLKQWNMYIGDLKSLIYNDDFQDYYILKVDLKSFYDSIDNDLLEKQLNEYIEISNIEENKEKFKQIASLLIEINKQIVGEIGVPQGPAYARYLAEIFLTPLDKKIESYLNEIDDGYYFRYVDDFFVLLPHKEDVENIQKVINEYCYSYNLTINEEKVILNKIENYKDSFEEYINDTKYFIDKAEKNIIYKDENSIYNLEQEILSLIYDDEGKVIDKNLSFIFTHLTSSEILEEEKEKLINYIINESKNRGSFYYHFWKWFFEKISFDSFNFMELNTLIGLKREIFLHYFLILLINEENFKNNPTLSELFNYYIENTELSKNEQLILLSIFFINKSLISSEILDIISDKNVYLDIAYSNILQKIDNLEFFKILKNKMKLLPLSKQLEIWFNIIFYHKSLDNLKLNFLINEIINILNVMVDVNIEDFLRKKTNINKLIQIMFIISLFLKSKDNLIDEISHIWRIILKNLERINFNSDFFNEKYYYKWIQLITENQLEIKESNLILLLSLIGTDNLYDKLLNEFTQYKFLFDYFFNKLLMLLLEVENLDDSIKKQLIKEKNVLFLEWLKNYDLYPDKEIFLYNALYNDILIFRKDNRIYYRISNNYLINKYPDYLFFKEESREKLFDEKYKYLVLEYDGQKFDYVHLNELNIIEFLKKFKILNKNRVENSTTLFKKEKFFNIFEKELFTIETIEPLNIYDYCLPNFIYKNNSKIYNKPKNLNNYIALIINIIERYSLITKFDNKIYTEDNNFIKTFLPYSITNKYEFLLIFATNILEKRIIDKYDLENIFVDSIIRYMKYIEKKEDINFFDILKYYFEVERKNKNYSYFKKRLIEKDNLERYLTSIKEALSGSLKEYFKDKIELLREYIKREYNISIENFVNSEVKYYRNNLKVNNEEFSFEEIKLISIIGDEIKTKHVTHINLTKLKQMSFVFATKNEEELIIVEIPEILLKLIEIIENLKEFKPYIDSKEIESIDYFNSTIEVLKYHWDDEFKTNDEIKQHLINWLKPFNDKKHIEAILYVISNHIYFDNKILNNFKENLENLKSNGETIITLKQFSDFNGTHILIEKVSGLRQFESIKNQNFIEDILKAENKIIIVLDNIISGSQAIKCLNYYFGNTKEREKEFFNLNKEDFNKVKEKFKNLKEIIFLTAIYTNKGKEKILDFFQENGIDKNKIKFLGIEIPYKKIIFNKLHNPELKEIFIEICKNKSFIKTNFKFDSNKNWKKYKERSEFKENEDKLNQRDMIVRLKSTPKQGFWLFRLKPKHYEKSLFNYREIN